MTTRTTRERLASLRERITELSDPFPIQAAYAEGDFHRALQALEDNDIEEFHNYLRSGHERLDRIEGCIVWPII